MRTTRALSAHVIRLRVNTLRLDPTAGVRPPSYILCRTDGRTGSAEFRCALRVADLM